MTVLADWQINELCSERLLANGKLPMIQPFSPVLVREEEGRRIISYGLSSFGYDIRLSNIDLKVFTNINAEIIDPKKVSPRIYTTPIIHKDEEGAEYVILPPNTGMLGHTVEYFSIPRDVIVTALGKSTYARVFTSVIVTPLEPEWEGQLVVEIMNLVNLPAKVYLGEGIAQLMFNKGEHPDVSYADRGGKYQGQTGTQDALV